jgi:hypothetical protein
MNLQIVRNECIRFGGHAHIEVSYKILRLEVLVEAPIFHLIFRRYCFETVLIENTLRTLQVNT